MRVRISVEENNVLSREVSEKRVRVSVEES